MVFDFVIYEFITKHIKRLNVGYERMVDFLYNNKDEVISSFKGIRLKKIYMVYEHIVLYYYTTNQTERARELFKSLPEFLPKEEMETSDKNDKKNKKKDKNKESKSSGANKTKNIDTALIYLYKQNEHFLKIKDNIKYLKNEDNYQYCYPDSVGKLFYNYNKIDSELREKLEKSYTKEEKQTSKKKNNKTNKKPKKRKKKKKKK